MILISILSLWTIGRFISNKEKTCLNAQQVCSKFLSYYYGNSSSYSLYQIHKMKQFYLYFPIYQDSMSRIRWNSYLELLKLPLQECYFYYALLLFCGDDYQELRNLICSHLYSRIHVK